MAVARPLLWLCVACAGLTAGLLVFGATDRVTSAPGAVRPVGEARPLQSSREGRIETWLQPAHASVRVGEAIARLDTREEDLRLRSLHQSITALTADERRLATLLDEFGAPDCAPPGRAGDGPAVAGPGPADAAAPAAAHSRGGRERGVADHDANWVAARTHAGREGPGDQADEKQVAARARAGRPCAAFGSLDDQHGRERDLERGARDTAAAALATLRASQHTLRARRVTLEDQARWLQPACRAHRELAHGGRIAPVEHWESERRCVEEAGAILTLEAEAATLTARLVEQSSDEVRRRAGVRQQWGLALAAARQERRSLEAEQALLLHRVAQSTLRAPAAGRLHCQRPDYSGVWVPAGEALCQVVPETARAEVVAQLPEQDREGVFPGQPVSLRILALPWTRHGVLPGRVINIAPDTRPPDMPGAAPVYAVTVLPLAGHPLVAELALGMRVEVDFHRGREALWRWLLAPMAESWLRAGREP